MKTALAKKIVAEATNRDQFRKKISKYVSRKRADEIISVLDPLFVIGEQKRITLVSESKFLEVQAKNAIAIFTGEKVNFVPPMSFQCPWPRPGWMTQPVYYTQLKALFGPNETRTIYDIADVEDPNGGSSTSWRPKGKYPERHGDVICEDFVAASDDFIVKPYIDALRFSALRIERFWMMQVFDHLAHAVQCFIDHVLIEGSNPRLPLDHFRSMAELYVSMIPLGPRIGHKWTWVVLVA